MSGLAQMLAGAIGGGGPPMMQGGVRAPGALGAGPAMPAPAPGLQSKMARPPMKPVMPGPKKAPLPGKAAAKPGKMVHADKENKKEQKGETKATERAEGYRREV